MKNVVKVEKVQNVLKHYGVLGMKWGVRKEDDKSSPSGPIKNQAANYGNRAFFSYGVRYKKASDSPGLKSSGSRYALKFDRTSFTGAKAWKKKKSSGGGSKKGSATREKAEQALKEKVAKASSRSSAKGSGGSKVSAKSESKTGNKETQTLEEQDENLVSLDPDFDERNFTAENKLGNTKFYAFKNKDNQWVISDKETKWVLPLGMEIDKKDFAEKIEKFETALQEIVKSTGYEYTEEELDMWRTAAINKIVSELRTPQQETNERIAELINNLLGNNQSDEKVEDKSNQTKIDDKVAKTVEELEEKKKR